MAHVRMDEFIGIWEDLLSEEIIAIVAVIKGVLTLV